MILRIIADMAENWPLTRQLWYLTQRLTVGGYAYKSHGETGECPCRTCLIMRMRIAAIEEELDDSGR